MWPIIKEGRRRRYIGFAIQPSDKNMQIKRADVISEIRKHCRHLFNKNCKEMGIYLTRFDGKKGIVRCNHVEKGNTIELLISIDSISSSKVKIKTLGASGTIKALVRKHMDKATLF